MADLTPYINPLKYQLDHALVEEKPRTYLGFSSLGDPCRKKLWLGWRWASKKIINRRLQRLFARGHAEEEIIIQNLATAGVQVTDRQDEMVHTLLGKHCMGHSDGTAHNVPQAPKTPHLFEAKTMADKYFNALVEKGLRMSDPKYYGQINLYMRYKGLTRTLFVATNKNNDKREYLRIPYDEEEGLDLHRKATDIVTSELPPRGISLDPAWHECRWCQQRKVCHGMSPPQVNCRTCAHSVVADDGVWECAMTDKELSEDEQHAACGQYKRLF